MIVFKHSTSSKSSKRRKGLRKRATTRRSVSRQSLGMPELPEARRQQLAPYYRKLAVAPADVSISASLCAALWHVPLAEAREMIRELAKYDAVYLVSQSGSEFWMHNLQVRILRGKATAEQIKQWHADIINGYIAAMSDPSDWGTLSIEMHSAYFAQHVVRHHAIPCGKAQEAVQGALYSLAWLHQHLVSAGNIDSVVGDLNELLQCIVDLPRRDIVLLRSALAQTSVAMAKSPSRWQLVFSLQQYLVGVSAQQQPLCALLMQQCDDTIHRCDGVSLQPTTALSVDTSLQHVLHGHTNAVNCVATYTMIGDDTSIYAVSGANDQTLRLWRLSTGELINSLHGSTRNVNCVATYQQGGDDGDVFAVSDAGDTTLRVWDLTTGTCIAWLHGHTDSVRGVATYTEAGVTYAVSASYDRTLCVWNMHTMNHVHTLTGHTDFVSCVAVYLQDGDAFAVSASDDRTLRLWRLSTGRCVRTLTGHTGWVKSVATYRRGDAFMAVSGSRDRTLCVWALATGECTARMDLDLRYICSVDVYHKDGTDYAVAGTNQGTIEVFDLEISQRVNTLYGHRGIVRGLAVYHSLSHGSDAVNVVSASTDTMLRVASITAEVSQDHANKQPIHSGQINDVAMYRDAATGQIHAVTASADQTLRVWDERSCLRTLTGHTEEVACVAVFIDGDDAFAVSGSADNTLRLWHLASGKLFRTMTGHTSSVTCVAVYQSNGSWYAVTGSCWDNTARLWQPRTGTLVWSITVAGSIIGLYHHHSTCYAVSETEPFRALVVNLATEQAVRTIDFMVTRPTSVHYAPDAVVVASAHDSLMIVYDPCSDAAPRSIEADGGIVCIATAAVASTLYAVVATKEPLIQVINLHTGRLVYCINTAACVTRLAFFADASGAWIACGYGEVVQLLHCRLGSDDEEA